MSEDHDHANHPNPQTSLMWVECNRKNDNTKSPCVCLRLQLGLPCFVISQDPYPRSSSILSFPIISLKREMPTGHSGTQLSEGIQIDAPTEFIKRRQNPQRIINSKYFRNVHQWCWVIFFLKERHTLNSENDRSLSNSLSILVLHPAYNNSATKFKVIMPWSWTGTRESFLSHLPFSAGSPATICLAGHQTQLWCFCPRGTHYFTRVSILLLWANSFWYWEEICLPATPTHRPGPLPQSHSAWLHPLPQSCR